MYMLNDFTCATGQCFEMETGTNALRIVENNYVYEQKQTMVKITKNSTKDFRAKSIFENNLATNNFNVLIQQT